MNIQEKFDSLKKMKETALIAYITAGFPTMKESIRNLHLLSENGADIIEIGIPFSDPIADGPTIQYSSQIALNNGINLHDIIREIGKIKVHIPLVLMSYLNPLLSYGKEKLFRDLKKAGLAGIIIPDLPVEESKEMVSLSNSFDIDMIFLVAPTSTDYRIKLVNKYASGFIYCVSITGTTGVRKGLPSDLLEFVLKIKSMTDKPLAVGFGISNPDQIKMLSKEADGIIVGSRIVEAIRKKEDLGKLVKRLKNATQIGV